MHQGPSPVLAPRTRVLSLHPHDPSEAGTLLTPSLKMETVTLSRVKEVAQSHAPGLCTPRMQTQLPQTSEPDSELSHAWCVSDLFLTRKAREYPDPHLLVKTVQDGF